MFSEESENYINSNEEKENENKENLNKETDCLVILWDIVLTIFDNIIIVKANKYEEIHFHLILFPVADKDAIVEEFLNLAAIYRK
jgi:hypothetical protein